MARTEAWQTAYLAAALCVAPVLLASCAARVVGHLGRGLCLLLLHTLERRGWPKEVHPWG